MCERFLPKLGKELRKEKPRVEEEFKKVVEKLGSILKTLT